MNHDSNDGQILNDRSAKGKAAISCGTCGASVAELRRGRCWACYSRWQEQRPVGLGASCAICEERRRDNMRLVEVQGRSLPFCHICAAHVAKLDVVPYSVEGLRAALRRDRRQVERREGDPEHPLPSERRAAHRRAGIGVSSGIGALVDDESVYKIGAADLDLDLDRAANDLGASDSILSIDDADIVEDVTVIALEPEARPPVAQAVALEAAAESAPATLQADAG
jgi:hypothetical protein